MLYNKYRLLSNRWKPKTTLQDIVFQEQEKKRIAHDNTVFTLKQQAKIDSICERI
jgi:hypothetical protein